MFGLRVLVAQDNPADQARLVRACNQAGLKASFHFVANGEQAIAYLQGWPPFENPIEFPLPNLLLLDLQTPSLGSLEVLEWLHARPELSGIIAVVTSSTVNQSSRHRAYELGAKAFLAKRSDQREVLQLIQRFERYWDCIPACAQAVLPEGPLPAKAG